MSGPRILTTRDVKAINSNSVRAGYNRTLTKTHIRLLDPEGVHLTGFSMVHNDDHLRVELLTKIINFDEPVIKFLDLSFDDYERYTMSVESACTLLGIAVPA